ncbi:MgtC/SapB family protein [Peribacillus simplex]|nr:MgtC/SapB family protein [Peribacillus simplex]WHX93824.1 MgtC/SapB family protein [Peribacillus simplex]
MLIAVSLGFFIGLERQWHNCIAGLRTNILMRCFFCRNISLISIL